MRVHVRVCSGVARIWCEGGTGPGTESAEGGVGGEGVSPSPHWGWSPSPLGVECGEGALPPPQIIFLNFYIKMVSSGAFWVAISYRLAACFTGIGSTCGVEIYWRSFRHIFGNYNYSTKKTVGKKMTI